MSLVNTVLQLFCSYCFKVHVRVTLFPVLNLLYFYISILRSMRTVPNMAVFCSSLISCLLLLLLLLLLVVVVVAPPLLCSETSRPAKAAVP